MSDSALYTIGFAGKSAEEFFGLLEHNGVSRIIDVRLRNRSGMAAFTRRDDLRYFLKRLLDIPYTHVPELAPAGDLLRGYRNKEMAWEQFEAEYREKLRDTPPERVLDAAVLPGACLLCSERSPERCHRRLVGEHLQAHVPGVRLCHL